MTFNLNSPILSSPSVARRNQTKDLIREAAKSMLKSAIATRLPNENECFYAGFDILGIKFFGNCPK